MATQPGFEPSIIWENDEHTCRIVRTMLPGYTDWYYCVETTDDPDLMGGQRWRRVRIGQQTQGGMNLDEKDEAIERLAWGLIKEHAKEGQEAKLVR